MHLRNAAPRRRVLARGRIHTGRSAHRAVSRPSPSSPRFAVHRPAGVWRLWNEGVQFGKHDDALLRRRLVPRADKDRRGGLTAIHDDVWHLWWDKDVVARARDLLVF